MRIEAFDHFVVIGSAETDEIKVKNIRITPCKRIIITSLDGTIDEYRFPSVFKLLGDFVCDTSSDGDIIFTSNNKIYFYVEIIFHGEELFIFAHKYFKNLRPEIIKKLKEYKK